MVLLYCHAGMASVPIVGMKKWSFQEAVMKSLSLFSSSLCHWMFLNMVGFEAILAFFELLDTWTTHADFTMPFGLRCDTHWRRPSAAPAGSIFRIESNMDENSDCCNMCHPPNPSNMFHTKRRFKRAQSNARNIWKDDERPLKQMDVTKWRRKNYIY